MLDEDRNFLTWDELFEIETLLDYLNTDPLFREVSLDITVSDCNGEVAGIISSTGYTKGYVFQPAKENS